MAEPKGNAGYISNALTGVDSDGSVEVKSKGIGKGQKIVTPFALDNVCIAKCVDGMSNGKLGGSTTNLSHSLKGASAVDD